MDNKPELQRLRGADIHRLSIFKVVVELGGLSPAADFLGIDLSTVSRHIKDLEIRLGLELCHRGPGGFRDDGARKEMVRIFDAIGARSPTSDRWRSRLATILY